MLNNKAEMFSTKKGVIAVKSPVKQKILHKLANGEKTGREIRKNLERAKSTISVHLSDLEELGLIKEKTCSSDKRKKVYSLTADFFGRSQTPSNQHYKKILKNLRSSAGDSDKLLRSLFHLIRYGFDSLGINVGPALKEIGRDAGKSLAKNFDSVNLSELLKEIKKFWKDNKLGEIKINDNFLLVYDCFDCGGMPDINETVCSLDEGMIEGIIKERTGEKISVQEVECFGTGENRCKFKMSSSDS
ncbi:hypothetical protein AKJ51_03860 [candidate division MSBL1 archaeon SCGC-AAA382A20]|uniref:4-vinyl reductase 4VR domain-containing protein n=1 Tax=candidate division MSBL1 archaeon SCGC-AAA382A20 TaxID=1698280 RepID=A0A133VIT7_9EURY|nr:hypothetical protein AKJ51_03860 [candidate division MSBL1 archaeon SCGC-AAA382A20]